MDESLPAVLGWLFTTPSWVPAILATALTAWLIWITRPTNEAKLVKTTINNNIQNSQATKSKSRVNFSFLSDWEPPFRQNAYNGGYAEELWLSLRADGNLENVKIKIRVDEGREIKKEFLLDTDFTGSIPKDLEHKIKLFSRSWEWQSGRFIPNSDPDSKPINITNKVDSGALFFSDTPHEMEALKGRNYLIIISALHSDGPDVAKFHIRLGSYRPESVVSGLINIETVNNVRKAQFGETYLS